MEIAARSSLANLSSRIVSVLLSCGAVEGKVKALTAFIIILPHALAYVLAVYELWTYPPVASAGSTPQTTLDSR